MKPETELKFKLPTIAQALRFRIDQYGWTDARFAKEIGVSAGFLCYVLKGRAKLGLNARIKAYKLGVPARVLLQ